LKERAGIVRPFSVAAEISCREYSLPLQRAITDFGADVPFHKIPAKLTEHYGISVPVSSSRVITEKHAEKIFTWGVQKQPMKGNFVAQDLDLTLSPPPTEGFIPVHHA
jgi:hypothetical protein